MNSENSKPAPSSLDATADHYDASYFSARYGRIASDPEYHALMSQFWKATIFEPAYRFGVTETSTVLDYGAGTGVVSAAMPYTVCFDTSEWSQAFLRSSGRTVLSSESEIPTAHFDAALCSHSLEHYEEPLKAIKSFHRVVKSGGILLVVLPIEKNLTVKLTADLDQHLYAWTFQSISNLLRRGGWEPIHGQRLFGPVGLGFFGGGLSTQSAVGCARLAGRVKRWFPSIYVIAKKVA